jgi:hypothetical protein
LELDYFGKRILRNLKFLIKSSFRENNLSKLNELNKTNRIKLIGWIRNVNSIKRWRNHNYFAEPSLKKANLWELFEWNKNNRRWRIRWRNVGLTKRINELKWEPLKYYRIKRKKIRNKIK